MKLRSPIILIIFSSILFIINTVSAYTNNKLVQMSEPVYNPFPMFAFLIVFVIVMLCVYIYAIIWVYKDAKKRGQDPILWIVLILVGGLIGIVVYLVLRKSLKPNPNGTLFNNQQNSYYQARMCPACGRSIPFDANFCPYCNKNFGSIG